MKRVTYSDRYQKRYQYVLTAPAGKRFDPAFRPELTPRQMLKRGVFGGAYFDGVPGLIPRDLPRAWFVGVTRSPDGKKRAELNDFGVNASQSRSVWIKKGWISRHDPHGWFQWYCRYYLGRRLPEEDARQIRRWKAIRRHATQVRRHCMRGDRTCRPRQRQALLHWAYDSRKI